MLIGTVLIVDTLLEASGGGRSGTRSVGADVRRVPPALKSHVEGIIRVALVLLTVFLDLGGFLAHEVLGLLTRLLDGALEAGLELGGFGCLSRIWTVLISV